MSQPVILTLWAPDFKETDNNLWAVCVQISHHGAEKSKATAWRRCCQRRKGGRAQPCLVQPWPSKECEQISRASVSPAGKRRGGRVEARDGTHCLISGMFNAHP